MEKARFIVNYILVVPSSIFFAAKFGYLLFSKQFTTIIKAGFLVNWQTSKLANYC